MLVRAYSTLDVKSFDEDERTITGIASTPATDRMGDVVEPRGAAFRLPLPLLWQHDAKQPIGFVTDAKVTPEGISIKAQLAKVDEPGALKDRLDMAWQSIKAKLVRGLSIGFRPTQDPEPIKGTYGLKFGAWEWLELSAVTIPANQEASIQLIKSCDTGAHADRDSPLTAGTVKRTPLTAGSARVNATRTGTAMKNSISQQIADLDATLSAKEARMDEMLEAVAEKGEVGFDQEQKDEYETLESDVKTMKEHRSRLVAREARAAESAKRVVGDDQKSAGDSRDSRVIVMPRKEAPGIRFARMAKCIAAGKGSISDAIMFAKHHYPGDEVLAECIKTAVGAATTANGQAPLLQYTDILSEFVDYVRPLTIIGKFGAPIPGSNANYPNVTRVPFAVRVGTQTAGGSASWVGEAKPIPLTNGTFSTATLDFTKVAAISVITKEEARFTSISAEAKVRDDLAGAVVQRMDADFIDPSNAGTAGVKPASITNGVAAIPASGTTAAAFAVDVKSALAAMLANNVRVNSLVAIMSQQVALSLSLMRTSLGVRNFADITMNGGYLEGIPVIVTEALTSLGSPSTPSIVFVNAKDVFLADDGNVTLESSDQASLEMSDAPAQNGANGTGASMVSLWQTQMLGIKALREVNWKLVRSSAVQYISGAAYTPQ